MVWRVGYRPQPWAWVGWEWASEGRFPGRWDDAEGNFRTVYAGSSLLGCLLELLADFRADPLLEVDLGQIVEDPEDAAAFPTVPAGVVDPAWLTGRIGATAKLTGRFCAVTAASSLAALHPIFIGRALHLGLKDFDAAAMKDARARELTQQLASHLYATTSLEGVVFQSRHGDDITLWAVFERPGDELLLEMRVVADLERVDSPRLEVVIGPNLGHRVLADPDPRRQRSGRPLRRAVGRSFGMRET